MSNNTEDQPSGVGPSSDSPIPAKQSEGACQLQSLVTVDDPIAEIILVGDISISSTAKVWGQGSDFFWPEKVESVDISEFVYLTGDRVSSGDAVKALGVDISKATFESRSNDLKNAVENDKKEKKATPKILVGYGYGGLLCEQVIANTQNSQSATNVIGLVLFGTPHFVPGLMQWAEIVLETKAQPEVAAAKKREGMSVIGKAFSRRRVPAEDPVDLTALETAFEEITVVQRSFFLLTRDKRNDWWGDRIASCFPISSSSDLEAKMSILPEWSVVPHAVPVMIRKPYLEMTQFTKEDEIGCQVILGLIRGWVKGKGDK